MGREAGFELNCSGFSGSVTDFIKLLGSLGWICYDDDNHAEYLPVGDNDNFEWQMGEITESELYAVFDLKLQREETVGVVMYYRGTEHGVTLLAADTGEIHLIPNISRKTLTEGDEDSVTDVNWYAERIIQKLLWYDCGLTGFSFEESEGDDGEEPEEWEDWEENDDADDADEADDTETEDDADDIDGIGMYNIFNEGNPTEDTENTEDADDEDDIDETGRAAERLFTLEGNH